MVLLLAAALLAGCTGGSGGQPVTTAGSPGTGAAAGEPLSGEVTIFAAASLTNAFKALGEAFTAAHPGVEVTFNFAGSQTLATQITQGAPADVFASANPEQMAVVEQAGAVRGQPRVFARNEMAIAVEPGNPLGIDGLAGLAHRERIVVLAAPQVPAGAYARQVLANAGVDVAPDSLEQDVREAMSKVALGEADAAIVYTSDIVAADGDVGRVAIPEEVNVAATYPLAQLTAGPNPRAAAAFVDFATSQRAREILADHGFAAP